MFFFNMLDHPILTTYLAKTYLRQVFITAGVVIGILFVTSAFEILQKYSSAEMSPKDFWQLITFKIPHLFSEVISLCCFVATILFLNNITKQNELIIILNNGIPVWKIFIIPALTAFLVGIVTLLAISPLGTIGLKEYEKVREKITKSPHLNFIVSQTGMFFFEAFDNERRIIQAESINIREKELSNVTILIVDDKNHLLERVDTNKAVINRGFFTLYSPIVTNRMSTVKKKIIRIPTNLSVNNLVQTFTPPEMITIWNLSASIEKFAKSGLSTLKYQIYYYKQLFKPLSMIAMSLVACWFISLNIRENNSTKITAIALILGVCTYFFLEMMLHILAYSGVHPILATMLPILFIIILSSFVILHFQES